MMQLGSVIHRRVRNGLRLSMVLVWGSPWARPIPLSVGDQVTVPGDLPGTFDPVVVARGGTATGTCLYDRLRKGRGTLDIGELVPMGDCASDVLLFAQGRAMTATSKVWSTGADVAQLPSPPVRVKVEFSMVLVANGSLAAQQAGLDTVRAIQLFNRNRVGLTFHASRIIKSNQLSSSDATTIGGGCDQAKLNTLAKRADPVRQKPPECLLRSRVGGGVARLELLYGRLPERHLHLYRRGVACFTGSRARACARSAGFARPRARPYRRRQPSAHRWLRVPEPHVDQSLRSAGLGAVALLHWARLPDEHGQGLLGESGGHRTRKGRPHLPSAGSQGQHSVSFPCPGHGPVMSAPRPRRGRARGWLPCLLALALTQGGCNGQNVLPVASGRERIDAWLLCQDCTDGELDSLTALGNLHPAVVESLSTDLLAGPSATRRSNIQQQVDLSFDADTAYEHSVGAATTISSADYVALYTGNYVAVYRARAAVALAAIGGPRAGTALDSAIADQLRPGSDSLRPDVKQTVVDVKDTLWEP